MSFFQSFQFGSTATNNIGQDFSCSDNVVINGKRYSGGNTSIRNGVVYVDGQRQDDLSSGRPVIVNVTVEGDAK